MGLFFIGLGGALTVAWVRFLAYLAISFFF